MVTLTKYGAKYNRNILFLEGLSTDTKPTDEFDGLSIQNGSEYTEVDTGKKFLFDYDNATWYEVQTGGGGGGGGGTGNYNDLSNRPSVNNTVLTGNKTSAQLGLASSKQGGKADSAIQGVKLNSGSVITPDANNIVDITVGKADVGLGNVTNDAQVKKISSSTSGDIVTWGGTSGDTVADSGVSIETSITDSNLKIPTSKAVKTALDLKADATDIPTVNNATITIQKNGTKVSDFTVNASSNKTINITVPTTASDVNALPSSTKYAGAATAGGSATSAAKLDTASAGSVTQPVYFTNGVPTPTTYSLEKSVPSDAVFTDTTYSNMSQSEATTGTATNGRIISAKVLGDTIDEKIAKLGYKTVTVNFNDVSWSKTSAGVFYTTTTIDASANFDKVYSATLYDFGNLASNIAVTPYIRPDAAKFGLLVTDSTNPQTLPMTTSTNIKVALFGVLK